jgi:DNA-binding NtrC family response regulator
MNPSRGRKFIFIMLLAADLLVISSACAQSIFYDMEHLQRHDWKGKMRELKNIMERAVILTDKSKMTLDSLSYELQVMQTDVTLPAFAMAGVEKMHRQRVLNHENANKLEAARLLNIGLTTLYRKIEEYKLAH